MAENMDGGFARWVGSMSRRTNRSMAGSRIHPHDDDPLLRLQAATWGIVPVEDGENADMDSSAKEPDVQSMTGPQAIDHARSSMPVLHRLMQDLRNETDFTEVRIAACLILEPKTTVFLEELADAGAVVGVFCGPDSTDERVIDNLRGHGVIVRADRNWDSVQAHDAALNLLDVIRPDIIVDDGASFARLASLERPSTARSLLGVAEETTSGVRAFTAMQAAGDLDYPVIAVNDSPLKTGFDNAHGTGETCVTTIQGVLGDGWMAGRHVTVIGYGPVGRGFALRARALGTRVTICDIDPIAALRAVFEGFPAQDLRTVLPTTDLLVSATGIRHTVDFDELRMMHEGAVLAVIGGIANELPLDEVPGFVDEPGRRTRDLHIPGGPTLVLVAEGDGVNYTIGGGNPIDVMDLSFAVQAAAVARLIAHGRDMSPAVHQLDDAMSRRIASIALESRGFHARAAGPSDVDDWRLTRFADVPQSPERSRP